MITFALMSIKSKPNLETMNKIYGIITLPLVALRADNSERSEMASQLLFGECVEILETQDKWLKVKNLSDNYVGWVDRKMIEPFSLEALQMLQMNAQPFKVCVPLSQCWKKLSNEKVLLPASSILWLNENNQCVFGCEKYDYNSTEIFVQTSQSDKQIIHYARQFFNAPYLWGGKSILGIDCSGLVQVVFSIIGIQLPRDASQQVEIGTTITSLQQAKTGDLAFFTNEEGRVVHVGILINNQQIIHASGWVKIEQIDANGIISSSTKEYTHKLFAIRRILK